MIWKIPDPDKGLNVWEKRFAFFPMDLDDGNRVFWEWIEAAELVDLSTGGTHSKDATRVHGSDWMPWWAVEGGIKPKPAIVRVERHDV